MHDREQARLLLVMAGKDLQALEGMTEPERFADEIFGFHAQQAVEKSFKAWLAMNGIEYPHTHDLAALFGLLQDAQASGIEQFHPLVDLSDFAVQFRYDIYGDEPVDRKGIDGQVDRLVQHVEELLKKQTDPTQPPSS